MSEARKMWEQLQYIHIQIWVLMSQNHQSLRWHQRKLCLLTCSHLVGLCAIQEVAALQEVNQFTSLGYYWLIWTWSCSSIWRQESGRFAHESAVCHFVVELFGVDNFGLHCYRSLFSEGVSIKQHVELTWREDSQAVGWIRCEGVCSGTDSTWSFSSVWIYILYKKKVFPTWS